MPNSSNEQARILSIEIASELGPPRFYLQHRREMERSLRLFEDAPMVGHCLGIVGKYGDCYGHGLLHVRKVAIDAGAIILTELDRAPSAGDPERAVLMAHLAGLLHDIKRAERDHARAGAREASGILTTFALNGRECSAIVQAIANHEAFQIPAALDDPAEQLLSDALYDADKFRWGPDNFTETLWAMLAARNASIAAALPRFPKGMEALRNIRDTFRTATGRAYGPEFIDLGLEVGLRFYAAMTRQDNQADPSCNLMSKAAQLGGPSGGCLTEDQLHDKR
jgi:HD superfamily phosphodiesterase